MRRSETAGPVAVKCRSTGQERFFQGLRLTPRGRAIGNGWLKTCLLFFDAPFVLASEKNLDLGNLINRLASERMQNEDLEWHGIQNVKVLK